VANDPMQAEFIYRKSKALAEIRLAYGIDPIL